MEREGEEEDKNKNVELSSKTYFIINIIYVFIQVDQQEYCIVLYCTIHSTNLHK